MRQVVTIADENAAKRLADHLLTMDVTTRVDRAADGWIIWVHREDRMDLARGEVAAFLAEPDHPRYQGASKAADLARREKQKVERLHARNSKSLSGRLNVPSMQRCPITYLLIAVCVAVALLTGFGGDSRANQILMFSPIAMSVEQVALSEITNERLPAQVRDWSVPVAKWKSVGLRPISRGQVWRVITPIFLHFSGIHLLFNMVMLYRLGGLIELRKGSIVMAALVLATGVLSNAAEYLWDVQRFGPEHPIQFGGMSGVVYALFGYCWMKSDYDAEADMKVPTDMIVQMILWLLLCMSGIIGPIANAAHVAGLASGLLIGVAPHLLPTRR